MDGRGRLDAQTPWGTIAKELNQGSGNRKTGIEMSGRAVKRTRTPRRCRLRVREKGRGRNVEGVGRRCGGMSSCLPVNPQSSAHSLGWKRPLSRLILHLVEASPLEPHPLTLSHQLPPSSSIQHRISVHPPHTQRCARCEGWWGRMERG